MQYNHELDKYKITSTDTLKNCIYGGRGIVCLVAPSNKAHTYRFSKPKNTSDFPEDVIFVTVLHERKYFYIGMIEKGKFRRTKNSRFEEDNESVKGAKYLVELASNETAFNNTPMRMFHAGKCAVCGRKLDSARGIAQGVGPKCIRKLNSKLNANQSETI